MNMTRIFIFPSILVNVLSVIEISGSPDEDLSPIILVHGGAGTISPESFQAKVVQGRLKFETIFVEL